MKKTRIKKVFGLLAWIFAAGCCLLPGGAVQAQKVKVDNVHYELKESYVEIWYDLIGEPDKNYKVTVKLKRESDPAFSFTPRSLSGNVGKGRFAGEGRKITWYFSNEFKPAEGVEDYYFEVTAVKPSKVWIWVAGGALVAGGTTAAILLLTGKKDEPAARSFPIPSRP